MMSEIAYAVNAARTRRLGADHVLPPAAKPSATASGSARLSPTHAGEVLPNGGATCSIRNEPSPLDGGALGGEQLLEALGVVERPDEREAQVGVEEVARDALDVVDRHGVEAREDLGGLDGLAL